MRYLIIMIGSVLFAASVLLFSLAPDTLSLLILSAMALVLALGFVLGIVPVIRFSAGFRRALKTVREAVKVQAADASLVVLRENELFRQSDLDEAFLVYKDIVLRQQQAGEIRRDIEEFLSEDLLSLHSWQGLVVQIPGILTGLGILGTFIGLISGIGTLAFTSVEATIQSIADLIAGIEAAFYTSISGVILSILFNILYRIIWNDLLRVHALFLECYHKQVIPPTDVQSRHELHEGFRELFRRLDRFPQSPGYSPVHSRRGYRVNEGGEQLLMPQVVQAMEDEQFVFYFQPIVTLKTRRIVGAEALVRWNHPSLGVLTPAAFLPVLEANAYITKLDVYIWEQVCRTLRAWLDSGVRPLPVTLNISKADVLALDLPAVFTYLLKQYKLPPRMLELDIPANAYLDEGAVTPDVAANLRAMGLKVVLDSFDGDFLAYRDMQQIEADGAKLDLRFLTGPDTDDILSNCFSQARTLGIEITASGIENAGQLAKIESMGCVTGQGFYFYHPMPVEDYEKLSGYKDQKE